MRAAFIILFFLFSVLTLKAQDIQPVLLDNDVKTVCIPRSVSCMSYVDLKDKGFIRYSAAGVQLFSNTLQKVFEVPFEKLGIKGKITISCSDSLIYIADVASDHIKITQLDMTGRIIRVTGEIPREKDAEYMCFFASPKGLCAIIEKVDKETRLLNYYSARYSREALASSSQFLALEKVEKTAGIYNPKWFLLGVKDDGKEPFAWFSYSNYKSRSTQFACVNADGRIISHITEPFHSDDKFYQVYLPGPDQLINITTLEEKGKTWQAKVKVYNAKGDTTVYKPTLDPLHRLANYQVRTRTVKTLYYDSANDQYVLFVSGNPNAMSTSQHVSSATQAGTSIIYLDKNFNLLKHNERSCVGYILEGNSDQLTFPLLCAGSPKYTIEKEASGTKDNGFEYLMSHLPGNGEKGIRTTILNRDTYQFLLIDDANDHTCKAYRIEKK